MYRQSNILSHLAHTYGIKTFLFSYKGTKHLYILQVNHHFFISKTLVILLFLYRNITRIQNITMYNVFLFLVTTSFSHFMHLESGSVGAAVFTLTQGLPLHHTVLDGFYLPPLSPLTFHFYRIKPRKNINGEGHTDGTDSTDLVSPQIAIARIVK